MQNVIAMNSIFTVQCIR